MDFYVSNAGDDSNPGTMQLPWRTIGKVNAEFGNDIQLGDSIYFRCGDSFTDISLRIKTGGTPTNPMTISSYGTGYRPNFNKSIYCDSTNIGNITVENFDIGPVSTRHSLQFDRAGVTNIIIRNVDIHNADLGIFLTCIDTFLVEDCHVYDSLDNAYSIYGSPNGEITNGLIQNCVATNVGEGFTIHGSDFGHPIGAHHMLLNCKAINISVEDAYDLVSGDDIQMINCETQNAPRGIAIGHEVTNVLVDGYKGDNTSSFGIFIGNSNGVILKNSMVTNAGTDTVRIYEHAGMHVENVEIYNCVFIDKPDTPENRAILRIGYGGGVGYEDNINVHDNIFISYRLGELVAYVSDSTPDNTNSQYSNNIWWQTSGSSDPFGRISGIGDISFDWWQNKYPTDTFQEPSFDVLADIVDVDCPLTFVPGTPFSIHVSITNVGGLEGMLFIRITNKDTGEILGETDISVPAGETTPLIEFMITLVQTTDFNGRIAAGHDEQVSMEQLLQVNVR